jgi:hypothetical protein
VLAATLTAGWSLPAPDAAGWRSWGALDGLPESFVSSVVVDPAGTVWSIHGTSGMSRMDGYSVDTNIPAFRYARTLFWMPDGVWASDTAGLHRLREHDWEFHLPDGLKGTNPLLEATLRVFGPGRFLIVLDDLLGDGSLALLLSDHKLLLQFDPEQSEAHSRDDLERLASAVTESVRSLHSAGFRFESP